MTWLAPWALVAGALGMLGVVAAHLLSRQRPRALSLATARFLPSGMLEATTLQTVPMDRWWMLLRLLIVALLALGVSQPVLTGSRVPTRTVLLLDRTLPVAAQRKALASLTTTDVVIAYDSGAVLRAAGDTVVVQSAAASLSAALGLLTRVRDSLAERSTSMRVAVASRFAASGIDPATPMVRRMIPDSIAVLPVQVTADSAIVRGPLTVLADGDDPIAATAVLLGDSVAPRGALLRRGATLTADDSAMARDGATVISWPARTLAGEPTLQAITVGGITWIAPLGRDTATNTAAITSAPAARAVGWWADGAPAVWMTALGRGCLLRVSAALPSAGDQTLSLAAQAWLAALVTQCDRDTGGVQAPPVWLSPSPKDVPASVARASLTSGAAPWLVGAGLALALLELLLRLRRQP